MKPLSLRHLILLAAFMSLGGVRDASLADDATPAVPQTGTAASFEPLKAELRKEWPRNRTVRFVFHGHSVPAGYFKTPTVQTFDAYPSLFHQQLCEQYPTAVIDVSVTAIGGENSVAGAKRFDADVLVLKPDVVFIDYSLNDRGLGLEKSEAAWRSMIEACREKHVLIVLLTPTPDSRENLLDDAAPLAAHAAQIRKLAAEYHLPVVDSYEAFRQRVENGTELETLMSQINHPNRKGHEIVAGLLGAMFSDAKTGQAKAPK
jgi:lysophospholipase L1-like esterase